MDIEKLFLLLFFNYVFSFLPTLITPYLLHRDLLPILNSSKLSIKLLLLFFMNLLLLILETVGTLSFPLFKLMVHQRRLAIYSQIYVNCHLLATNKAIYIFHNS